MSDPCDPCDPCDPYIYTPAAFQPTPHLNYSPYAPAHSPLIPPSPFPPSPLPPTSPYLDPTTTYPQAYSEFSGDTYRRPLYRRPSWHAGTTSSPYIQQTEVPYHSRRRSFSNFWGNISNLLPWAYPRHGTSPHIDVHPLLCGDPSYTGFYLNLSSPTFSPMHRIGPGEAVLLSPVELRQPATNPPITRMRITHHSIPQWPVDLRLQYDGYQMGSGSQTPITVGDVLYMIHTSLHRQITHDDWYQLSDFKHDAVTRAYYRRCSRVPSMETLEAQQGVKRVDYLKEEYMFAGLIRAPDEDGFFHWNLITERSY